MTEEFFFLGTEWISMFLGEGIAWISLNPWWSSTLISVDLCRRTVLIGQSLPNAINVEIGSKSASMREEEI